MNLPRRQGYTRRALLLAAVIAVIAAVILERASVAFPGLHPYRRAVVERVELLHLRLSEPQGSPQPPSWPDPPPVIAHAGGTVAGQRGTNSLEALNASLARGVRLFEVDLHWTEDRQLVLLHDWNQSVERLFGREPHRMTASQFLAADMKEGLTQMTVPSLASWVSAHSDVWIVSDVKARNIRALGVIAELYPRLAARLIPQVYRFSGVDAARSLGYGPVILTVYRKRYSRRALVELLGHRELFALTIPQHRANDLPALVQRGARVYLHTVNDAAKARKLMEAGARGVYSDDLSPADLLVGSRVAAAAATARAH
jgi:glycerophosphoryl diester phosphodiesterase